MPPHADVAAIILAGGLSRRMGGQEKSLLLLNGMPLVRHVAQKLLPQVSSLAINANGNPERFAFLGLPVLVDPVPDNPGPIAGLLAGLGWAARLAGVRFLLTAPTDTPFLPDDLVTNLLAACRQGKGAHATSGGRAHPVIALWPISAAPAIEAEFANDTRAMRHYTAIAAPATVEWPKNRRDQFLNLNTPDDFTQFDQG